jgi:hypothetical protein
MAGTKQTARKATGQSATHETWLEAANTSSKGTDPNQAHQNTSVDNDAHMASPQANADSSMVSDASLSSSFYHGNTLANVNKANSSTGYFTHILGCGITTKCQL